MNSFDFWLSLLPVVIFIHYSIGSSCLLTDKNGVDISVCPSLCSGPNCSSNLLRQIQAFTEETHTHHCKCFSNGVLSDAGSSNYTERHIIFVKNKEFQNIYLTINEDSSTSIPHVSREYTVALVSKAPVNWIFSGNHGDAKYFFYKNHVESTVQNSNQSSTISSLVDTSPLSSRQIMAICCSDAFDVHSDVTCDLTSYLEIEEANSIKMKVGVPRNPGDLHKRCEFKKNDRNVTGDQENSVLNDVHVMTLKSLPLSHACSSGTIFSKVDVFAVELSGHDPNAIVKVRFPDAFKLKSGDDKVILLLASGNVMWQLLGVPEKDVDVRLTVVVPSGNSVDTDGLVFDNNRSVIKKNMPAIGPRGKRRLDEILQMYQDRVVSYANFFSTPDHIEISFLHPDVKPLKDNYLEFFGRVGKDRECFPEKIHAEVSCQTLKEYNLNPSQLVFGNGTCTYDVIGDVFHWDLCISCGVNDGPNVKKINFVVGDKSSSLKCFKPKPPKIMLSVYNDVERKQRAVFPQTVSKRNQMFQVEVNYTELERQDYVSSIRLEKCVLVSRITSTSCVHCSLVDNNCPVDGSTRLLKSYYPQQVFLFSVQQILDDNVTGPYDISCTVSRCISRQSKACPPALPKCEPESETDCRPNRRKKKVRFGKDSIELKDGPFYFSSAEDQSDLALKTSDKIDSRLVIAIMTVIGFVIGVLFVVSLCCIKTYYNHKAVTASGSLYNQVNFSSYSGSTEDNYTGVRHPLASNYQQTKLAICRRYDQEVPNERLTTSNPKYSSEATSPNTPLKAPENPLLIEDQQHQMDNESTDSGYPHHDHKFPSGSTSSVALLSSRDSVIG